jgi:hypothetical protein
MKLNRRASCAERYCAIPSSKCLVNALTVQVKSDPRYSSGYAGRLVSPASVPLSGLMRRSRPLISAPQTHPVFASHTQEWSPKLPAEVQLYRHNHQQNRPSNSLSMRHCCICTSSIPRYSCAAALRMLTLLRSKKMCGEFDLDQRPAIPATPNRANILRAFLIGTPIGLKTDLTHSQETRKYFLIGTIRPTLTPAPRFT